MLAIALAVCINFHNIYRWVQHEGLFKCPIEVNVYAAGTLQEYSVEDLSSDSRITFNQSLMLINTQYSLGEGFVPEISEYKDTTVYMNDCMLEAYAALSNAVRQKTGNKLYVSSDFRTAEEQWNLPICSTESQCRRRVSPSYLSST